MIMIGTLFTILALLIVTIAAIGVLRLPNALARQHAATKAATIGVLLFVLGLAVIALGNDWGWGWLVRLGLIAVLLVLTLPLASHAVARAGVAEKSTASSDR